MSITIYINEKTSHYYDMKETVQISLRPRHRYKGTREGTGEEGQESDQHSLVLKLHTQWHHHALHMKIKCCESYWDRGTVHPSNPTTDCQVVHAIRGKNFHK